MHDFMLFSMVAVGYFSIGILFAVITRKIFVEDQENSMSIAMVAAWPFFIPLIIVIVLCVIAELGIETMQDWVCEPLAIFQKKTWRRAIRWIMRKAPNMEEVLEGQLGVLKAHKGKLEELRTGLLREINAREANIGKWHKTLDELALNPKHDLSRYRAMAEDLQRILSSRRELLGRMEIKLQELECGKQDLDTQKRLTELYQETAGIGGNGEGEFIDNQTKELLAASDAIATACDELFRQEKTAMLHLDRPVEEVADQIADGLEIGEKSRRRGLALIS